TYTMKTNNLGILEPTDGEICTNIDVIIVPGLAFDQSGNRLGFGSGYYDKFLNSQSIEYKIALAFDFQVVDKIDIIEHDVPMDLIITENRTIKVR
ncbi:MAG TPA: 5-formyltetrahydrofolate cyclo-ligase, partial [Nitrososphaerales archaeon]|nr:5-formyltetrahydrofolate cyclo-ligase [Nitrososphaerales archaeon]